MRPVKPAAQVNVQSRAEQPVPPQPANEDAEARLYIKVLSEEVAKLKLDLAESLRRHSKEGLSTPMESGEVMRGTLAGYMDQDADLVQSYLQKASRLAPYPSAQALHAQYESWLKDKVSRLRTGAEDFRTGTNQLGAESLGVFEKAVKEFCLAHNLDVPDSLRAMPSI